MTDVITPNLGLTKPDVGASDDTWGGKLNANFDILDAAVTSTATQNDALYVNVTGDTMTGGLGIQLDRPFLAFNALDVGQQIVVTYSRSGSLRWFHYMQGGVESELGIGRCDDTGAYIDSPFTVNRAFGIASFSVSPVAPTPPPTDNSTKLATTAFAHARTPQITVGTTAPSIPAVNDVWIDTN